MFVYLAVEDYLENVLGSGIATGTFPTFKNSGLT
jgi:hypothetical protein